MAAIQFHLSLSGVEGTFIHTIAVDFKHRCLNDMDKQFTPQLSEQGKFD